MSDTETLDLPDLDESLARRLLEHRTLVLGSVLDERLGNRLCQALLLLAADDRHDDIQLWINSPGGSVSAMLAIRDVMRTIPNDVATVVTGTAYSAGQFLLSAGTPGKRYALPHSRVLLHQGSAGFAGTAMDIAIQADDLRYTVETVIRIVAEDTGQSVETIERDSRRDRMFTAEQARSYGFVDQVITTFDQINPSRTRRTIGLGGTS
jgi:ATP-dependent Clp protease protease subunit